MSDPFSGVFLCTGFKARRSTATNAFIKPVNIRMYSAPPPVRMRVVTYDVRFIEGTEQPSVTEYWKQQIKTYQSPFSGNTTFSFTTGTLKISMDELFTLIRRHFYDVVLKGKGSPTRTEAFNRLMNMNAATRRYVMNDTTLLSVFDVHHCRIIDLDQALEHIEVQAVTRYRGAILDRRGEPVYDLNYNGNYISTDHDYVNGRWLLSKAVDHFKNPDVQSRIINETSTGPM
jgi:hypothetical protein